MKKKNHYMKLGTTTWNYISLYETKTFALQDYEIPGKKESKINKWK